MNDHQQITAERGRRAADLRAAAVALLEQQTIAAGVMLDLDSDQVVAAGPKAAILYLLSNGAPATASGDELPPLPDLPRAPVNHTHLGGLFDRVQMHQYAIRYADLARAAVSAATKPTADLSKLTRYGEVAEARGDGEYVTKMADGEFYKVADVQSLLATKPAAVPEVPEELRNETVVDALKERRAAVFSLLGNAGWGKDTLSSMIERLDAALELLAATPAASTTGAAQTAEQVRDQALEEAAVLCEDKYVLRSNMGHTREASTARALTEEIRALKSRPTPTHSSEAGDA